MHRHYLGDAISFILPIILGPNMVTTHHDVHPALPTFPETDYHSHNIFSIIELLSGGITFLLIL